jgi:hypothetical protein
MSDLIAGEQMPERPSDSPPWPKSEDELVAYIREMVAWGTTYGRCVYSMSYASVATFNYISYQLGVTGFQASCADLDILRHTRLMKHGFMILNAHDLLYPQYDLLARVRDWIHEMRPQLASEAQRLLADDARGVPAVRKHWEKLAALAPKDGAA